MSALLSMAQQFSGLPMKSLIGAPLKAATDANAMMAHTQTQFMLSTCFNERSGEANNKKLDPIIIEFELTRSVIKANGEAGKDVSSTFKLPLLTLIPLNSLAVDDVKVHFEMEVSSSTSKDSETEKSSETAAKGSFTAKYNAGLFSCDVSGSVSSSSKEKSKQSEHYEASNKARYEVDVHAGQMPLPTGVTTIINAFMKNVDPIMLKSDGTDTGTDTE